MGISTFMTRTTKTRRLVTIAALLVGGIQLAYIAARTVQTVLQATHRWTALQTNPPPEAVQDVRLAMELVARSKFSGSIALRDLGDDRPSETTDGDGDSLTEIQELFRMTSDSSVDSDEDGIPDSQDFAPNGFAYTYRDRIQSAVYSHFLNTWSPGDKAYCVAGFESYLDLHSERVVAVVITRAILAYLQYFSDEFPREPCRSTGFVTSEPVVFIPGAFYAYDLEYDFGGRCGGEMVVVFADLPFVGPFHLFDRWLWIS